MTSCNNLDNVETLQKVYECLGSALGHVYDESTNPVWVWRKDLHTKIVWHNDITNLWERKEKLNVNAWACLQISL